MTEKQIKIAELKEREDSIKGSIYGLYCKERVKLLEIELIEIQEEIKKVMKETKIKNADNRVKARDWSIMDNNG